MADYPTAPEGTSAAAFFESMEALGFEYAGATHEGGRFQCPHPGHEDGKPSLDVTIGRNGKPILNCKPCELVFTDRDEWFADVRAEGLRFAGVPCEGSDVDWGERAAVSPGGSHRVKGDGSERVNVKTIVYDYKHSDGSPNFRAYRVQWTDAETGRPDKTFFVRHYVRGKGYLSGFGEAERTPWKFERFADWAARGEVIYLVEGEKAARALHKAHVAATTFPGGANGALREDWVARYGFDRFPEVRVWPDADGAGVLRAERLLSDLRAAGVKASAWAVTEGVKAKDDAYDALKRGVLDKAHRLSKADALALADLNPAPARPEPQNRPSEPRNPQDKALIPAKGYEAADAPVLERDEPYSVAVSQEPYEFAAEVLDRHYDLDGVLTLRFRHDDRTFWLWNGRKARYEHLSEDEVIALVKKQLRGAEETFMLADGPEHRKVKISEKGSKELLAHFRSLTLTSTHGAGALLPSVGGVPFRNGWLNVETGELEPIGPERDIRWNVSTDYSASAECPEWIAFLESLGWDSETEEYRLLRQWFGYVLSGRKDQERALLMLGPSRSGKGTIIRVMHALLGDGAVGTSLESLTQQFGLQPFIGRGLATIGDARFGRNDKGLNARLLSLTSNDELPVDVKYGKPLSINLPVRLMIATNETPNFIEASDALARRFEALVFERSFAENPDHGLFKRLRGELPGIARWAIGGLRDLEGEGKFVATEKGKNLQKRMIEESAFVRIFVDECCVLTESGRVSNEDLYAEYATWATQNNMPVFNSVRFARELVDAFPSQIRNGSFKVGGRVVRGKFGVKLR